MTGLQDIIFEMGKEERETQPDNLDRTYTYAIFAPSIPAFSTVVPAYFDFVSFSTINAKGRAGHLQEKIITFRIEEQNGCIYGVVQIF